jgi:hypothetical protein
MTWQPIETAPKDGTWVLLYDKRSDLAEVAQWDSDKTYFDDCPIYGWHTANGIDYMTLTFTHWMPMPEPPDEA